MLTIMNDGKKCNCNNGNFDDFNKQIQENFKKNLAIGNYKIFRTNATSEKLWDAYLGGFDNKKQRQHHNCNDCKSFVKNFGGLVVVDLAGNHIPLFWDNSIAINILYAKSNSRLYRYVKNAKINGVFYADDRVMGVPESNGWEHFFAMAPNNIIYEHPYLARNQKEAEKKEDFKMLINGLIEYNIDIVEMALKLLKTDNLYRSEKVLGVAEWFYNLHISRNNNPANKHNISWAAVANAPAGFCHIKSSMIGTLLDDIKSGLSYDNYSRKFASKMNPDIYQRPQSAPDNGNIEQAEKIIVKMGIESALERRFARIDEIQLIWEPKEKKTKKESSSVFGHLKKINVENKIEINNKYITWEKFNRDVLPNAEKIEFLASMDSRNYTAILTAYNESTPVIFQWDNPFSSYVYINGSRCIDWNLKPGYHETTGITVNPAHWNNKSSNQHESIIFIIKDCKDLRYERSGIALFPEILKSELHPIRKTIEAYSRSKTLHGFNEASACGIAINKGYNSNLHFRVLSDGIISNYIIDRWE